MRGMQHTTGYAARHRAKRVVVVNAGSEPADTLGTLLDAGHYDTMLVESGADAFALVRHVRPDHVIVLMRIDDHNLLPLLSALSLDVETRGIQTSICVTQLAHERDGDEEQLTDMDELPLRAPLTMH